MTPLQGLLLIDHGSTKAESNAQLLALCALYNCSVPTSWWLVHTWNWQNRRLRDK